MTSRAKKADDGATAVAEAFHRIAAAIVTHVWHYEIVIADLKFLTTTDACDYDIGLGLLSMLELIVEHKTTISSN